MDKIVLQKVEVSRVAILINIENACVVHYCNSPNGISVRQKIVAVSKCQIMMKQQAVSNVQ